jgi:type IV secretion system protein VirB8
MSFLSKFFPKKNNASKGNDKLKSTNDYFKRAKSWADECVANREVTLSWFKLGFGASMGVNVLLVIAVMSLASIKTLVPLMVHHYDNGVTTVEPLNDDAKPKSQAQVESDIVRYITNRESYDISSYREQFDLVTFLSDSTVMSEYIHSQKKQNPESPINTLGIRAERSVHVYAVNFLDSSSLNKEGIKKDHHDVAEITFKVTDKDKQTGQVKETHYNALISWRYTGMPKSPRERWLNWSGFEITRYSKQLRNI